MNFGTHGMIIGEIDSEEESKIPVDLQNRLENNLITYKFVPISDINFDIKEIDVSNYNSTHDVIEKLNLGNDIYRIVLKGTRNIDISKLKEEIMAVSENVCEIIDNTKKEFDLEKIAKEDNLKGAFVKKMREELKNHPEDEEKIFKAIECVFEYI